MVAFIFREEVYKQDDPDLQGKAELIIAKQRNGPTGKVKLAFIKNSTRFESLAEGGIDEEGLGLAVTCACGKPCGSKVATFAVSDRADRSVARAMAITVL